MTNFLRRQLLLTLVATAGFASATAYAESASSFPSKPITIIVPAPAGGMGDTLARLVGEGLTRDYGQPAAVESKPGAGGIIGATHVQKSAPDGYTLLLSASGIMAVNPYVYADLRYRPLEDFSHVTVLVDLPFVLVTNKNFPANDLKEFVAYAKAHPKDVSMGNAGQGTQQQLTQIMFAKAAGIDLNFVSYKGSMPASVDLMGGHIISLLDNTGVQTPFILQNKVKPLMVTSPKRVAALPNIPTAQEAGLADFSATAWFGLAAPKGTPEAILQKIQTSVAKTFSDPAKIKILRDLGTVPVASTPAETTSRIKKELAEFSIITQQLGVKPQ